MTTILTQGQTTVEFLLDPSTLLDLETELSQTTPNFIDISWINEMMQGAAERAQAHYLYEHGENYRVKDLKQCFISWFDSSMELLCDECFEMCVEDSLNPFNRHAFEQALLRIKPTEDIQSSEEETMPSIQVPDDTNLGAQISQAKVGVILHHLEKMRTQVELIDLLDAFEALLENEKDKNEIRHENLDYAINRLKEAELAIRYQENWIAPRNWSAVCNCQNNGYSPIETLPH